MKLYPLVFAVIQASLTGTLTAQIVAAEAPPAVPAGLPARSVATPLLAFGAVRGAVQYTDGSPVSAAEITLTPASGPAVRTTTGADGEYAFTGVPAGPFTVSATGTALQPDSTTGTLEQAASVELQPLTLRVAALVTTVNAISQEQAAEIEVESEEHQRVLGAIPNFLVTYEANPVPLSSSQKVRLSLRTLFDPASIAISAIVAGGEQATGSYAGFGNGAAGYARRFGANFGDATSNILLTDALLPSIFHQDPRYFYKGEGSTGGRVGWVLRQTFEQKGDNGRWQFAWSNTLGDVGSALISNTYYPHQNTNWGTVTGENLGIAFLSQGISNVLQEFVFGRLTTHRGD